MTNILNLIWVCLFLLLIPVAKSAQNDKAFKVTDGNWNQDRNSKKPNAQFVEVLYINWKPMHTLTSIFCDALPNLKEFNAKSIKLKNINENAFENCKKLTKVDLYENNIQTIPPNTFSQNKELVFISFFNNELKNIPPLLSKII